jgi:hypothetical protein
MIEFMKVRNNYLDKYLIEDIFNLFLGID